MNGQTHPDDRGEGDRHPDGVHLSTDEARAGATPHMTRYVLSWGLGLVIVAFIIVLLYYMLNT